MMFKTVFYHGWADFLKTSINGAPIRTECAEFRIEFPAPIKTAATRRPRCLRGGGRIQPQGSARLFAQAEVAAAMGKMGLLRP